MNPGKAKVNRKRSIIAGTACLSLALLVISCGGGAGLNPQATQNGSATPSLSPSALTIANQAVGAASAPQAVTLSNTGEAPLSVSTINFTGSNPDDFSQTNNCGEAVAAGAACTINVVFKPAAAGTRTANLTVNNTLSSSAYVKITGKGLAPAATFSSASLAFVSQAVGTATAAQTVSLTNSGTATLKVTGVSITGTNASEFTESNNCGTSVNAGSNCTITVTFKPSASGMRSAAVSISDNDPTGTQTVSLSGIIATTSATVSPSSLTFANQPVGAGSAAQTITLTNSGNADMNVTSVTIGGTNAGDFSQTNNCGATLTAAGNCVVSVAFKPAAAGSRTATVSIADSATGSPQVIHITGTGIAPAVSLSPTSIAFGNQAVSTTSAAKAITLSNTGTAALSVSSVAISGTNASDFTQTNNCGSSVSAGSSCTISVTFKPAASGSRSAAISIADTAANTPQSVALTGTGTSGSASVSPTSISFGSLALTTASSVQAVTLSNTGNAALTVNSISMSGASDFTQTNNCGTSVAAGSNCKISVSFKPSATGTRNATISINDASGTQSVSLSGSGTGTASVTVSPTSLSFGNQALSTSSSAQTVTVTNNGTAALSVTGVSVTGSNAADFTQSNTCGTSVAAGAKCTISVSFKPSAVGSRAATISIADSATGSPQSVSLSGTGTGSASVSVSPSSLAFGSVTVGSSSSAQTATLSNSGTAALSITGISVTGTNSGDFSQSNNCGSSVAAGASCTINVTFNPSASGSRSASINIANSVSAQSVSLSGTGAAAASGLTLSPTSLTFTSSAISVTSPSETVTVTNNNSSAVTISSFSVTGANASDFSQANNCPSSLPAGASCTIVSLFTPSVLGQRTATISITDSASSSAQTVSLVGSGGHNVVLTWTASATADIVGYNIYRGTASGAESSTPINTTPISGTSFTDENVLAGTQYYYYITSVTSDGSTQSAPSTQTVADVPTP